jgi:predicted TIM-barrel fold metal-dependent hydrolase
MEGLRKGRLDVTPHYFEVDLPFYKKNLERFLPDKVIDIHAHVGYATGRVPDDFQPVNWPDWITMGHDMSVPELLKAYLMLFPGKHVGVVCFGMPRREQVYELNSYVACHAREYPNVWGFGLTLPEWTEEKLDLEIGQRGFCGIKSYVSMVQGVSVEDTTILDIFPHYQLEVAEDRGWVVMLHIPRAERLADEVNIRQLRQICTRYPKLKLVIAHVGRTYSPRFAVEGLSALDDLDMLYYDISANTCQPAFELLIEKVGPKRILYGSDLPIFAVRGRRVYEGDNYVNYIYGADWEDGHTRRCLEEGEDLTFMLYEEIAAFKRAAEKHGLTESDIEDVFYGNASQLLNVEL